MRRGTMYCVLARRTHAVLSAHDGVDLPVCHSLIHAVNFESQNVLPRQTAAVAGQKRAERSLMGTCNLHASSHRLGYYMYIFAKTFCPGKWSFEVPRSVRRGKYLLCCLGFRRWVCSHAVYRSLRATSRSARDLLYYEKVGKFFVTSAMNKVEKFPL